MQTVLLLVVLTAAFAPDAAAPPSTADLAFLTGCWRFEANGRVVEEQWMAPAGGSLLGMSRTVRDGKTIEFEFVQIRDLPEGLTYIARPSNQPEARFVAISASPEEVVFENAAHDFPQRVRYRASGDALQARIEGAINGTARAVDFPYARVACLPAP